MRTQSTLMVVLALSVSSFAHAQKPEATHQAWIAKVQRDFQAIKPGMTRAEVERLLPMDGGLQSVSTVRFVHPECPSLKLDVEFAVQTDAQHRAVRSKLDQVKTVSRPYLESPFGD